jgi:predicted dehydrogenase
MNNETAAGKGEGTALLRVGVIGLGHLGSLHAKFLSTATGAFLTAVHDIDDAKCREIAARHDATAAASIEELFGITDAVSIATPTSTHFDVAMRAIENGKHVFLEKPITETVEQASILNREAEKRGVIVQVGHIERFNPAIVALDRYNLAPLFVESHRLAPFNPRGSDVAVVLDLMIHDIDIILSLVRSDVEKIEASGVAVVSETIDIANARMQFANGCVANITASRISQNRMRKMRLFQKNAYISIDFLQGSSEVFRLSDACDTEAVPTALLGMIDQGSVKHTILYEQPPTPKDHNPLQYELDLFVEAARSGSKPVVDGHAAQQALEVAARIMEMINRSGTPTPSPTLTTGPSPSHPHPRPLSRGERGDL